MSTRPDWNDPRLWADESICRAVVTGTRAERSLTPFLALASIADSQRALLQPGDDPLTLLVGVAAPGKAKLSFYERRVRTSAEITQALEKIDTKPNRQIETVTLVNASEERSTRRNSIAVYASDYVNWTLHVRCDEEAQSMTSFGEGVLAFVQDVMPTMDALEAGASWFGVYDSNPFLMGLHEFPPRAQVSGYTWVVALRTDQLNSLGGRDGLAKSPAERVIDASLATGEPIAVAALRLAPAAIKTGVLRQWKSFLSPLLPPPSPRLHLGQLPALRAKPPLILDEDWQVGDPP